MFYFLKLVNVLCLGGVQSNLKEIPRNKGNVFELSKITYLVETDPKENFQTDFFGKKNTACMFQMHFMSDI